MGTAWAAPHENSVSSQPETEEAQLRRVGYQLPEGAKRVGRLFPSKGGDQVAFFEQRGDALSLVVAIKGGAAARWPMTADAARLDVFWVGPSEITLGTSLLTPRMRVKWYVAER